jgi:5'-3' exonuclease
VLELLKLTSGQFIDMCILSGCDFTPKPPGYGPATSYKDILKYGSMKAMLDNPSCFSKWPADVRESIADCYPGAFDKFALNWSVGH